MTKRDTATKADYIICIFHGTFVPSLWCHTTSLMRWILTFYSSENWTDMLSWLDTVKLNLAQYLSISWGLQYGSCAWEQIGRYGCVLLYREYLCFQIEQFQRVVLLFVCFLPTVFLKSMFSFTLPSWTLVSQPPLCFLNLEMSLRTDWHLKICGNEVLLIHDSISRLSQWEKDR